MICLLSVKIQSKLFFFCCGLVFYGLYKMGNGHPIKNLSQQNFDMGKCMIMPDYQGINLIVMFYPGTVYQHETYYVIVSKCLVF